MNSKVYNTQQRKLLFVCFIKIIQITKNHNVVNMQNYILKKYKLIIFTTLISALILIKSFEILRAIKIELSIELNIWITEKFEKIFDATRINTL